MKNIIPLVVAVVLGLVAVFAVSRTISGKKDSLEQYVDVVAASRMLEEGEALAEGFINPRSVAVSSLPKQHIKWSNRSMVLGQKLIHPVAKGDYVLLSDVGGVTLSKGNIIGDGEWGVPVSFSDNTLVKMLQPGDEIAIIGTYKLQETVKRGKDVDAGSDVIQRTVTTVIFPRVRILELTSSGVLLSLPPQQALALTAIQQQADLFPLLRKTNDTKAMNRMDGGIYESTTLTELAEGLNPIKIPAVPSEIKE
jgi:Flp pilus assembly protein CpaB